MRLKLLSILPIFICNSVFGQTKEFEDEIVPVSNDTVVFLNDFQENTSKGCFSKVRDSRLYQMCSVPVSLFILSGVSYTFEGEVRNWRNEHASGFNYRYDDYLQYVPGLATYGLKVAGVKGRGNWGETLTSTAISTATMVLLVNGIKYTVQKERPDGSVRNSFPSGHTATAFMTATWLHEEYGRTRSPLYSIGGYTVATIVGVSRILNNRHWVSDVLFGAGLGYLSAEIGSWANDLIFQKKKPNPAPMNY